MQTACGGVCEKEIFISLEGMFYGHNERYSICYYFNSLLENYISDPFMNNATDAANKKMEQIRKEYLNGHMRHFIDMILATR
jgi:hypothetical protein